MGAVRREQSYSLSLKVPTTTPRSSSIFASFSNNNRNKIANLYMSELSNVGDIKLPSKADGKYGRVWYSFTISTGHRDHLKEYLEEHGIRCGISYKIPVHLQPPYRKIGFKEGMYPNTEKWSNEILSIPLYSQITEGEASYIIRHIKKFYRAEI